MIKILYLVTNPGISIRQSGGAGTHIRGTIDALTAAGWSVLPVIVGDFGNECKEEPSPLISGSSTRNTFKKFLPTKVRLFLRDLRSLYQDYLFGRKIEQTIRNHAPDIIYERSSYLSMAGVRLARKYSIPLFLESDGCMVEIIQNDYGVFSARLGNYVERVKLKKSYRIVVMSKYSIDAIALKFRIANGYKFVYKPLGIDIGAYPYDVGKVLELKSKYGLDGKFVCGFVGAISKYHGVEILIEVAKQLRTISSIQFLIVGWSDEAQRLRDIANQLNLSNIIFTGKVDKGIVGNYYKLFSVGIIPDADENLYPIKVLEYGIFENCPVVPNYKVFNEIIDDGFNGFKFQPKNPKSLADLLYRIHGINDLRKISSQWKSDVMTKFQWRSTVSDLVCEFEKAVKRKVS